MDVGAFRRDGWVVVPGFLRGADLDRLRRWVAEIEALPPGGGWMQHDELGERGAVRTRTENFVPFHDGLRALLTGGDLPRMAGELLGEPAVLYKEKANYKHPGGAGFHPHQDVLAYPHVEETVSCLLAVDDAREDNGCLELAAGRHHALLPADDTGCVRRDVADGLDWTPCPVPAGSLLWFHGRTPHRSAANRTAGSRRALYLTYNALSAGDLRERYYADKRAALTASAPGEPQRISLIGHFRGVAPGEPS